ncbi:putative transcriptional regulator YheO [Desulfobaculum xiamenense]|uniref:Putative transcriptional regulator YheO n=1 Tax=Desulfobaculum xiamenense TaxID=995050 RepID=A0A846QVF0_9BACT|nr:putative transcriptional regulator YheO [Desulfobaculum xiamenense]
MTLKKASRLCTVEDYIPLVDFLGTFLGKDCEVVLHDTTRIESSVVAIANNHISGRRIGSPLTDLGLSIIRERKYVGNHFIMEYNSRSRDGKRLHSATYFIKDADGELLGMMCLNMDVTKVCAARDILESIVSAGGFDFAQSPDVQPVHGEESFHENIEDLTENMVHSVISRYAIPPDRMTADEKTEIVAELNRKGVFLIKGSVAVVARHLEASEATIYRYMQKCQD